VLIYADGYPSARSAQAAADKLAAALGVPATVAIAAPDAPLPSLDGVTGVAVIGRDQSLLDVQRLAGWLREAWLAGMPVLADNAGAAALGAFYSAHEPTPREDEPAEFATQRSLRQGETVIQPGAALLDVTIEPQVLSDNRWGRLFSLAYNHPDRLALGLTRDTALAVTADGAEVLGDNVVFALDLRTAELALGGNDVFEIANGLMDVFAPGEAVRPEVADTAATPARQPTPALPPTPEPTVAPTAAPTAPAATAPAELTPAATQPTAAAGASPAAGETAGSSWMIPLVAVTVTLGIIVAIGLILRKRRRP
jgi:hypothetical protein